MSYKLVAKSSKPLMMLVSSGSSLMLTIGDATVSVDPPISLYEVNGSMLELCSMIPLVLSVLPFTVSEKVKTSVSL